MIRKIENIEYFFNRKNVKNINLRVGRDGKITVSANKRVPVEFVDEFVLLKKEWLEKAVLKSIDRQIPDAYVPEDELKEFFTRLSEWAYEFFRNDIGFKPDIKVKKMTSAWGICHPKKRYISFNKSLYFKPKAAAEYVAVHEYTHFLFPNHQKNFYKKVAGILPDYKEREKLLKG